MPGTRFKNDVRIGIDSMACVTDWGLWKRVNSVAPGKSAQISSRTRSPPRVPLSQSWTMAILGCVSFVIDQYLTLTSPGYQQFLLCLVDTAFLQLSHISIDHQANEFPKTDSRFPPELPFSFRSISYQ